MTEVSEFAWVPLKPTVPEECALPKLLWSHETTVVGHLVYVTFGETVKGCTNRVFVLDYHNQHWTALKDPPPQLKRSCHTAFALNDKLWSYGGSTGEEDLGDLWYLDLLLNEWVELQADGAHPGGRYAFSAGYIEKTNELVVFGGAKRNTLMNDVYALNLKKHEWVKPQVKGKPPSPRACSASCVSPNKLFVFGGGGRKMTVDAEDPQSLKFNDLHVLSSADGKYTWSRLDNPGQSAPTARFFATITSFRDKLFVFGKSHAKSST